MKDSPGASTGCWPTTPGPFTSSTWPVPSVMIQWREMQLDGVLALVGDGDGVQEEPLLLSGARSIRRVLAQDRDADAAGRRFGREHGAIMNDRAGPAARPHARRPLRDLPPRRVIASDRGARFWLCERSRDRSRVSRAVQRLPVLASAPDYARAAAVR